MADFQSLLDDIALLVGGTQQTEPPPGFFSGAKAGDSTGVTGLLGCYSRPPLNFSESPVGILLPSRFKANLNAQGYEENTDVVRLQVITKMVDLATDLAILEPFRDSVPAIFRTHMQVDTTPGAVSLPTRPLYAFVTGGRLGRIVWQGENYHGWEFEISVLRMVNVTYAP